MALSTVVAALIVLGACLAVFGALSRLWACNPGQAVFVSRPMATDFAYWAIGLLYTGLAPAAAAWLAGVIAGHGELAPRQVLQQVAILLIATDLAQYWLHRAFHRRGLWSFHAVHHGAEQVNWTTAFRVHPVNYLLYTTSLAIAAYLLGFSVDAFRLASPIVFFSAVTSHANLNWTFGPFRYVLTSPVFHRWHHTASSETRDCNFAPMFPVWDLMFGTFYMPRGRLPEGYGAPGSPPDLWGQLWRPFMPLVRGPLTAWRALRLTR